MASGVVSDYTDTTNLRQNIATAAGVDDASLVTISVAAASVIITASIAVPASTSPAAVQTSLASSLGTTKDATAALGITVESEPSITESLGQREPSPPPPRPSPPSPSPPPPSPATSPSGGGTDSKAAALAGASGGEGGSGGGPPTAAIGGGAAVAVLLMVGLAFLYLRKKRQEAVGSQPAIALTAISLTTTNKL